ncbi:hypothetical protein EDB83DRAFT_1659593 [Lactarius deliciosus]|nr:hypothetical protein EDB83DRAFT_1659593 [Lactarius deliciosus]
MPPRMIGDFDDNANAFWSLHMNEAKSHDEARIQSLKDDMGSVLIFAGLFSVSLISFIVDKIHDLQVDPAKQMVYYQQQNVALLAQISTQVSSIAPQVSIPPTPPQPYPDFKPSSSDVRVNAFWFMSLVFSISAALLATLVQQWVRDYMHVFQRYSNPLKSARLRQYLYEGAEGWYMPMVAEAVPGLIHVSLFLFFVGLCDSLFSLNTTIGITTIVPIATCGLLYVLSVFAPIMDPQSPFQTPFSGMIWYLVQKAFPRRYSDRAFDGALKDVSPDMSTGKVQLAMEENEKRKGRDVQAIRWLIDNSTEDDEMESFAMTMPGTFTSEWGVEVWRKVSEVKRYKGATSGLTDLTVASQTDADLRLSVLPYHGSPHPRRTFHPRTLLRPFRRILGIPTVNVIPRNATVAESIPPTPPDSHVTRDLAINDLCKRVRHLLSTCNNRSLFANKELWRKRAHGCVETVASLVFWSNVKLELFGDLEDLERLLRELGETEKIRDLSAAGPDGSFVTRWICLSLVIVTRRISSHDMIKSYAELAIDHLSRFQIGDDGEQTNDDTADKTSEMSRRIDDDFKTASQFCVYKLRTAFTEEQVRGVLARDHDADISRLENVASVASQMEYVDMAVSEINRIVKNGLSVHLPGVSFDEFKGTGLIQPVQFLDFLVAEGQESTPQFVFLSQRLRLLCSYAPKLRNIIDGRGDDVYQEVLGSLGTLWDDADRRRSVVGQQHLMERQLWRLLDLRDGDGFGFSVEVFFLVLARLSSMSSQDTNSALYIRTFRAITSGWRQHKHCIGTQRVILNLICDIAICDRGIFSKPTFPTDIANELLILLENMMEGQSGSHFDDAMAELRLGPPLIIYNDPWFFSSARELISRLSARAPP